MDRLRKRLEQLRDKVRALFKRFWHNEPEGDRFRSLDILFVLGAVRYNPTTKWQRICWKAYCVTPFCSLLIMVLSAVDTMSDRFNLAKATWHSSLVLAVTFCLVKNSILNRFFESTQTAQNYINGKPVGSGDSLIQTGNDSACRKKCFQRLQFMVLVLLSMTLIDLVIANASFSGIDELLGLPRIFQHFGSTVEEGIHILFLLTLCPIWNSMYCAGTFTVCSLLYGFNTEYEIFVCGFGNIMDNVYSDVEQEFPSTSKGTPEWMRFQTDYLYWKFLEQRVKDQVKLHVQFAENLQSLEPIVKNLFGVIYYNAMVFFSPVIYVMVTNGLSGASFVLVVAISIQLVECYMWCRIVDSLKDTNEKLELKILDLITNIPYSQFHRKKYAEILTTLCIVKIFVRNHEPFSCGGVFPIRVEAFTELLHVGYTVFTFLRDLGKKSSHTHRPLKLKHKH